MARTRKQVAAQLKAAKASAAKRKKVSTLENNQRRAAMIRAMANSKTDGAGGEIKAARISSTVVRNPNTKRAKRLKEKYGSTKADDFVRAGTAMVSVSSLSRSAREPAGLNPQATNASGVMVGKKIAK